MSRNTLVINCDLRETRVCLIEDGVIAELHLERSLHRGTVGNIVLGRVTRVLPGMQAAFIDIGMERAAFLHVEDLIRPDDFEAYLDKGDLRDADPSGKGDGHRRFAGTSTGTGAEDDSSDDDSLGDDPAEDHDAPRDVEAEPDAASEPESDVGSRTGWAAAQAAAGLSATNAELSDEADDDDAEEDDAEDDDAEDDDAEDDHAPSEDAEESDSDADAQPYDRLDASSTYENQDEQDPHESDDEPSDLDPDSDPAVADLDEDSEEDPEEDSEEDPEEDPEEDLGLDDEEEAQDSEPVANSSDEEPPVAAALASDSDAPLGGSDADSDDASDDASDDPDSEPEGLDVLPPQAIADAGAREGRGRRRRRRRRRGGEAQAGAGKVEAVDVASGSAAKLAQQPRGAQPRTAPEQNAQKGSGSSRDAGRGQRPQNRNATGRDSSGRDSSGRDSSGRDSSGRDSSGRDRRGGKPAASRVSRSVPITEIVREGNEVVVQISKEPIGTKGARVTSHVSLPGRHVVYLPTVDHIGISKRIGSTKERNRLRQVIEALKPQNGGLIVRTVAEGLTKKSLKTDIGYLIALWKEVSRKKGSAKAPTVLYTELDLVLKTARDLFTDDVAKIIIDDREQHARLVRFVEMFLPSRVKDIELYTGDEPIFDAYGIEDEIGRALGRKVPLPSGGYLVIDQAEALTAIDVNTGRFVGKGSKDLEETALKTNLEAVSEIAYQLRLRNIGGLVILDLIDMDYASNREKVWRSLEQHLARDKAKTTINRISDLGLIEMTRKRTRESLTRMLHEPCFYCDGTGQIQSRVTVAYEILRQVRRERHLLKGYNIVVNAHPAVVDLLQTEEKAAVAEAERRYMRRLDLVPRREYHLEQFDLQGR